MVKFYNKNLIKKKIIIKMWLINIFGTIFFFFYFKKDTDWTHTLVLDMKKIYLPEIEH